LSLSGKSAWIFHGDVFDVTMRYSKWIARLGAIGYDALIVLNAVVNFILKFFGKGRISLSKKVKDSVKGAVKFINNFEETAADIAIANGHHYVVCGHIHHPEIKTIKTEKGEVVYLNSGDWVENLTALEYNKNEWSIYRYADDKRAQSLKIHKRYRNSLDNDEIFKDLVNEFLSVKK
jgi:UDP-2,3-diacylglucosamine pyrophosphatase LpxH